MHDVHSDRERLTALAARLRESGALGRSETIIRLFDFLLEQSLLGHSPKEIEIAHQVFGRQPGFDLSQDASIRVQIHRLRKKLEEFGAETGSDRLTIPRGEYRLTLQPYEAAADGLDIGEAGADLEEQAESSPARPALQAVAGWLRDRWRRGWVPLLALLIGIALGVAGWSWRVGPASGDNRATSFFWQSLANSRRPITIVLGDYYLFGEAPEADQVTRLVREFAINSRDDLESFLMQHPALMGRYVDLDLHYLPISAAYALRQILPIVNGLGKRFTGGRPLVVPMSQFTVEAFKNSDLVYSGYFSGLGLIRNPLFQMSGLTVGASYDELIDRRTGRHYLSDWESTENDSQPRRDYAYLASFPGPAGNHILVVAGTRDPGVMQAAEIAGDDAQLKQIADRVGGQATFEALFEVRTLGTFNLGSRLLFARPLRPSQIWPADERLLQFPDQLPSSVPDSVRQ